MTQIVRIGDREVGADRPVYLVAELSANHAQRLEFALDLVRAAKEAGADAVKLQTYTPDSLTIDCDNDWFRIDGTPWGGRTLYELYREGSMPWEWQPKLKGEAERLGLQLISAPFDARAVDFLDELAVPALKIASFELVDLELVKRAAATGRPLILSTGMASLDEIAESVDTARAAGARELVLLKCTSAYPAPPEEMNLRGIQELARRFGVPVGLSDHTLGTDVAVAAVGLGACFIEKHLTLSRSLPSPDAAFSLEPDEFAELARAVRTVERALGKADAPVGPAEEQSRVFRRSLFVVTDTKAGEVLDEQKVRAIRPGYGLHPRHLTEVLGARAARDIRRGTPLTWDLISDRH